MAYEMMPNTGKYGTGFWSSGSVADRRLVIDLSSTINILNSSDTPFYILLNSISKETAKQPKFEWMEEELFVTRTFNCTIRTEADTSTGDTIAFLDLLTPNNLQAFEAPPWVALADNYDQSNIMLTKVTALTSGTGAGAGGSWWMIVEKAGLQYAQSFNTITPSATSAFSPYVFAGGGTWLLDVTDPLITNPVQTISGYLLPIGYTLASGTDVWNPASGPYWHDDTSGTILTNFVVGLLTAGTGDNGIADLASAPAGVTTASSITFGATGVTSSTNAAYVQTFTPNMLLKGFYEGSGLPAESRKSIKTNYGYTQILKTKYSITNTAIASQYVGGDELARIRMRKAIEHKLDLEQTLLFNGAPAIDATYSESPKRTTGGFGIGTDALGYVKTHTNRTAVTHATTGPGRYVIRNTSNFYPDLFAALGLIFDDQIVGSRSKTLFCSQKWLGAFSANVPTSGGGIVQMQATPGQENMTYGITINSYITPFGRLNTALCPVLRGAYENYAIIVDFANLSLKTLSGRDTHIVTNAQDNDVDGLVEYILTEMGMMCKHEQTQAILYLGAS